jgi:hypothetical protein
MVLLATLPSLGELKQNTIVKLTISGTSPQIGLTFLSM